MDETTVSIMLASSVGPARLPTAYTIAFKLRAVGRWVVDTGANRHACNDRSLFESMDPIQRLPEVITAGGIVLPSGVGTVRLKIPGNEKSLVLTDVLYMPSFPVNLFSGVILYTSGGSICGKTSTLKDRLDEVICKIDISAEGLFLEAGSFYTAFSRPTIFYASQDEQRLWHRRLSHLGYQNVRKTASMTKGMPDFNQSPLESMHPLCHTCKISKSVRTISQESQQRAQHAFDVIHTDVVGPINPIGRNGHKWAVMYTDDATRVRWIKTFKYKREAYKHTITFVLYVKTQYDANIKMIRLDGGNEYGGQKLLDFLEEHGIRLEPTVPYTPEQNGVSERSNRLIFEKLRSILYDSKAPKNLWPEFLHGIVHVTNRTATTSLDNITPYEALAKDADRRLNPNAPSMLYKPFIGHLRVLGCRAFVHIHKERRIVSEKGEPRAEEGILVGFEGSKIYRVWIPGRRGITRTSTVTFDEGEESYDELVEVNVIDDAVPYVSLDSATEESLDFEIEGDSDPANSGDEAEKADLKDKEANLQDGEVPPEPPQNSRLRSSKDRTDQSVRLDDDTIRRNPKRGAKKPSRYLNLAYALSSVCDNLKTFVKEMIANAGEPRSYKEAMESDEGKWHQAMESEMRSHAENNTWELMPYETGMRVLKGKWVYKIKKDSQGKVTRYKARWVVKGYEQRYGIDYEETFAGVAKAMALKVLWAFAAQYDLEVEQMDAITAFIQGEVSEEIYVEQPTGFEAGGEPKVCRLKRALYGLKQSARLWQEKLSRVLQSLGYYPISADHCIYRNTETGIVIATYVDDFLIFGPRKDQIDMLKAKLHEVLKIEDLGPCEQFLGIRVIRDRQARTIHLVQDQYIEKVLKAFQMENSKPMSTPIAAGLVPLLVLSTLEASTSDIREYQSAIGSLMYALTQTRPDLAYAVSKLSRYSHNPGENHWKAVRHVFKYLSGTRTLGITYKCTGSERLDFHGYSDSDHGSCVDTRQSTSGYVFFMAGGPVSWKSSRQHSVTLSSTESEYYGLTNAAKEASWLRLLLSDLGYSQSDILPTQLYGDNIPSLQLAENPEHHQRSKHIDIQWHFIRNEVRDKKVALSYVSTENMAADGLTKILGTIAHSRFVKLLGMESL
jgi:hypothetical protein